MDSDQAAEARPEEPGATVDDGAPADPEAGADGEGPSDRTVVEEAEEILSMVDKMVQSQGEEAARLLPRWRAVLSQYQEQSELLDGLLEAIVRPLAQLLRIGLRKDRAAASDAAPAGPDPRVLAVARALTVLLTVRGHKTVVRFFPHDASDLEAVLDLLLAVKEQAERGRSGNGNGGGSDGLQTGLKSESATDEDARVAAWEAQSVLLLWLSMLILIPFGLATLDSSETGEKDEAGGHTRPYPRLVARIISLCHEYLRNPGNVRDMAALLLGRLLTRPDMGAALREQLDWSQTQLQDSTSNPQPHTPFLVAGVLQMLSIVFKLGQRPVLLPYASQAWAQLCPLVEQQQEQQQQQQQGLSTGVGATGGAMGTLARKLSIKLTQRIALTFLAPRLAPWRYQREDGGGGDLLQRLDTKPAETVGGVTTETVGGSGETVGGVEEGEFEIADEIEQIISVLLTALHDKDTIVRWSGAKGLGRVTGCLPYELADDVVDSITTLFKPTVAELARRGLLLTPRLTSLATALQHALLYDVRRGAHSVGAHVRDAAAYVCWACARAYAPAAVAPIVHTLASTLLTVACYDREVNCRRAAAAAFQESVGRLGNFPHGIDLIGVADYFMVGNLQNAYLNVAVSVARFPAYRQPLLSHLLHVKLRHWDKALRELAARALAALVPLCAAEADTHTKHTAHGHESTEPLLQPMALLDTLIPLCLDTVLEVRHGAVVAISALLPAYQAAGLTLSAQHAEQVANLVPAIDKARLYRGKGGEVLREAVSKLIGAMAYTHLPMNNTQHNKVLETLDENLRSAQSHIQRAAVQALGPYAREYVSHSPEGQTRFKRYFDSYLSRLDDVNVAVRRGYALALGALPRGVLAPRVDEVISALTQGTQVEEDTDARDAQARTNCVKALARVCDTLFTHTNTNTSPSTSSSGHTNTHSTETQNSAGQSIQGGAVGSRVNGVGAGGGAEQQGPLNGIQILTTQVLPCYHTCLRDYTTDSRGDVGSWVRDAAMHALTRGLAALAYQLDTYPPPTDKTADSILTEAVTNAVAALLKQAVERIARVRETAMYQLIMLTRPRPKQHTTTDTNTHNNAKEDTGSRVVVVATKALAASLCEIGAHAPAAAAVAAALPTDDAALHGVTSLDAITPLACLMRAAAPYRCALLEGLISSVGGIDAQLTKVAAAALLAQLADGGDGGGFAADVAADFAAIWRVHARSARMARPLLRAADLLVTRCPELCSVVIPSTNTNTINTDAASTHTATHTSAPWCVEVTSLARAETRQCTDVPRLMDAATLLSHLIACPVTECHVSAYQGLLVLLTNRYPKVRRFTAEQIYLSLLALSPEQVGGTPESVTSESYDQITDLLLVTPWDGSLDAARTARDQIAGLISVAVPATKAATGAAGARGAAAGRGDEYSSYQSLLNDTARGL